MRTLFIVAVALVALATGFDRLPVLWPAEKATATPPAPPDVEFVPTAADRAAAWAVLTTTDDGTPARPSRWRTDHVEVQVVGDLSAQVLAGIDETLAWMSAVTGIAFARSDGPDADVLVTVERGLPPRAQTYAYPSVDHQPDPIVAAQAQWDPHRGPASDRWRWEELLHIAGPVGDHGPPGRSVFHDSWTALAPTPFDTWLLRTLYTDPAVLLDPDTRDAPAPGTVAPQ